MKNGTRAGVFCIALFVAAFTLGEPARVSVDRHSFNPSRGETIGVTVRVPGASRVSIAVLDRDGFVTRLLDARLAGDVHTANWDGRDSAGAIVADEAYSFKVDVVSPGGRWTYFPAAEAPKTYPVPARNYSRRNAALMYDLPRAARVHAQAGSATLDPKTKLYTGPVLKTLVNRAPRPASAIVESWNGLDESGAVYVPDLPHFVTAILATDLPENAVIAFGNSERTFLDVAAKRTGTSLIPPRKEHEREHHHGLTALEDISPALTVTPAGGTWDAQQKRWLIEGETARLNVQLSGPTAARVARQPGRIVVFVDYEYTFERRIRKSTETIEIPLGRNRPAAVVSVNWQSDYGPLAANTIRLTASPRAAERGGAHASR